MTDEQLRELVRDAIARHLHREGAPPGSPEPGRRHPSHELFPLESGGEGPCLIEPTVRCTHCGYCLSYGH